VNVRIHGRNTEVTDDIRDLAQHFARRGRNGNNDFVYALIFEHVSQI
jgi:hypothetical protein